MEFFEIFKIVFFICISFLLMPIVIPIAIFLFFILLFIAIVAIPFVCYHFWPETTGTIILIGFGIWFILLLIDEIYKKYKKIRADKHFPQHRQ